MDGQSESRGGESFIPASQQLPEITFKGVVLSIILTIVLAAANAYLGLKVGLTISASIPAAVISMAVLRCFKESNVLENNIVQTAASSGEALTAGIIFTIPALIVIHYWMNFNYFVTMMIALVGGVLGVLFSVPLRRVLLADKDLTFPEGTAIGNVLKASAMASASIKYIIVGGGIGALISLCQSGFQLLSSQFQAWFVIRGKTLVGLGLGFNPALIGAGYIMGISAALSILLGIIIGWVIGVPVLALIYGLPDAADPAAMSMALWGDYIRYIGLGVMMVGGIWAVAIMFKPIVKGIVLSFKSVGQGVSGTVPRTERDIPIRLALIGLLILLIPLYFILERLAADKVLVLSMGMQVMTSGVNLWFVIFGGFVFASICAYFAGLVGSSANPLSSLALIALLIISLILFALLGSHVDLTHAGQQGISVAAMAIMVTGLVAASAAISNDTIQDLKAGQMVGATPWKQQVMLILGVVVAAMVIPLVLQLLFDAYGLAGVFPRPGMDPSHMLLAPQAGLVAAVVEGIFTDTTNWSLMLAGGVIAMVCLLADRFLQSKGYRLPVLAVGLGIYLPVDTSAPLVIGGILSYVAGRILKDRTCHLAADKRDQILSEGHQTGLLLACGLVAGAALMGVVLAIPFVIEGSTNALRIIPKSWVVLPQLLGIVSIIALCVWMVAVITKTGREVNRL